jgi:hypothetical protein
MTERAAYAGPRLCDSDRCRGPAVSATERPTRALQLNQGPLARRKRLHWGHAHGGRRGDPVILVAVDRTACGERCMMRAHPAAKSAARGCAPQLRTGDRLKLSPGAPRSTAAGNTAARRAESHCRPVPARTLTRAERSTRRRRTNRPGLALGVSLGRAGVADDVVVIAKKKSLRALTERERANRALQLTNARSSYLRPSRTRAGDLVVTWVDVAGPRSRWTGRSGAGARS